MQEQIIMAKSDKDVSAYKINDNYLLLKCNENKAIYDNKSKDHYTFTYEDEIPKSVKDNYAPAELYTALRYAEAEAENNKINLSSIDTNTLSKFITEENKPKIAFSYSDRYKKLINLKKPLETYYKIKVNAENINDKYYYNYVTAKYEPLDIFKLGVLLEKEFNIILTETDANTLYGMFRNVTEPNNDAITFDNVILNTATFEVMPQDTFTVKRINYNYLPLAETKKDTLTERTLKQIFIPKDKPSNTEYYDDFLQRNGASFKKVNKHKMIYLLTGTGDDGKGIILKILQILHGALSIIIKPKQLIEDFYTVNLSDTNVILMDELNKNSFTTEIVGMLKDISGRGSIDSRIIRSQETVKVKDYGVIFIATNTVPAVPYSEKAYWERLILINLPNKFIEDASAEDLDKNTYKANDDLSFELEADRDGIEWLISASIEAYKNRTNGFIIKQNYVETQFLYDGSNPINTFIKNCIIYTGNREDVISNEEIRYNLINFCMKHNKTPADLEVLTPAELRQEIGVKLKNAFDNLDNSGRKGNSTGYRSLKLNIDYDAEDVKYELKTLEDIFFNDG